MIAKGSNLAFELTNKSDIKTVSRSKLMFFEHLQELEAVAAASGGVGGSGVGEKYGE